MKARWPRLLGDIGGTHARWAWQAAPGEPIASFATYACADFASVQAVIEQFLRDRKLPRPARLAFGIATPVTGDRVRMTNHAWSFSIAELQQALGVERCVVLNDFAAIAAALPVLGAGDLRRVGGGAAVAGAPMVVIGAGTGLGVAALVRAGPADADAGAPRVVEGEGGHVTLAATSAREADVLAVLRERFGHVSAERAVSGPGLQNLYRALCFLDGLAVHELAPTDVSERGLAGTDPACAEALQLFAGFLGNVAGNLALSLGARGGVYVAGGIVPRLGAAFDALPFRERFEAKGRFRGYLERIPTLVVTAPSPGLIGAANALDRLAD